MTIFFFFYVPIKLNIYNQLFSEVNSKWLNPILLKQISETDPAVCPNVCGHSYKGKSRKAHLKRHLLYECGVPKKFRCHQCFKKFSYKIALLKHHKICTKQLLTYHDHSIFFD